MKHRIDIGIKQSNYTRIPKEHNIYSIDKLAFLLTQNNDYISNILKNGQLYEKHISDLAIALLQNVDKPVVLDIGANIGTFSLPLGIFCKEKHGAVFAFEIQKQTWLQFCANVFLNYPLPITPYHIGLGSENKSIILNDINNIQSDNIGTFSLIEKSNKIELLPSTFDVDIKTIDSLNLPNSDLIKIDVEGMEVDVIKGGVTHIKESHYPYIIFESWSPTSQEKIESRQKILDLVEKELGYNTIFQGEMCIAQHPTRKNYEINFNINREDGIKISIIAIKQDDIWKITLLPNEDSLLYALYITDMTKNHTQKMMYQKSNVFEISTLSIANDTRILAFVKESNNTIHTKEFRLKNLVKQ